MRYVLGILSILFFSTIGHAKDVAMMIAMDDGQAFKSADFIFLQKLIKSSLPDHEVIVVTVPQISTPYFNRERAGYPNKDDLLEAREEMLRKLKFIGESGHLDEGDRITHLFLSAHGHTLSGERGEYTRLELLGEFSRDHISDDLKQILEPIRFWAASDINIILDSCSTFCGDTKDVAERAKTLLRYLNAPDGRVFGSIVPVLGGISTMQHGSIAERVAHGKASLLIGGVGGVSVGVALSMLGFALWAVDLTTLERLREYLYGYVLEGSAYGALGLSAISYIQRYWGHLFARYTGKRDAGRLLVFDRGELAHEIPFYTDYKAILEFIQSEECKLLLRSRSESR